MDEESSGGNRREKGSRVMRLPFFQYLSGFYNCYHYGTHELAHVEIVSSMLYQLTRNMTEEQIKESGFDTYFVDHTAGVYTQGASGVPFDAMAFQSKGDIFTDLNEDLAAEMKARTTYDNILRLADDPDVREPIKFLRAREIVHYQRFAEALGIAQERADCKTNFYLTNPNFDKGCTPPCPATSRCECASEVRASETQGGCEEKRVRISAHQFEIKRPY